MQPTRKYVKDVESDEPTPNDGANSTPDRGETTYDRASSSSVRWSPQDAEQGC